MVQEGAEIMAVGLRLPRRGLFQAWCYVDPCECSLVVPPKTSSYLPQGRGNGPLGTGHSIACIRRSI